MTRTKKRIHGLLHPNLMPPYKANLFTIEVALTQQSICGRGTARDTAMREAEKSFRLKDLQTASDSESREPRHQQTLLKTASLDEALGPCLGVQCHSKRSTSRLASAAGKAS
jgi:hypothetical protein